jgi:GT2 family glycosyltransferase
MIGYNSTKGYAIMITIITAVHNQLTMNQLYYENLKRYTHYPFELIIIDNASDDGSREFFEKVGATVIHNDENYSYPYTQNQGIKAASHDYLAFLNNDIIVSPNWDKHLIEALNKHQLEAITCCGIERIEDKKSTKKLKQRWKIIKNSIALFSKKMPALKFMHRLMYGDWEAYSQKRFQTFGYEVKEGFVGNTVLFKRSLIEKVGLWDSRIQAADFDLYLRLKKRQEEVGDVKPLHYALGVFIHHYIRFTINSGKYPPFYDRDNHITIEEKWGQDASRYLADQSW